MRSTGDQPAGRPAGNGSAGDPSIEEARIRRGSSFGSAASAYAEHRPDYAEAAVRWALAPVADRHPVRVVDLGAGTGKLTATLVRLGAEVTAVEPDPAMLAELRRALPEVRSVAGSAEDIPLPDGSADAVVAGQAAHWFDMDRALPEINRVLSPGGVVAGLWNVDDDRVEWVAGLRDISRHDSGAPLSVWRKRAEAYLGRLDKAVTGPMRGPEHAEFAHGQRRTADSLVATIATHSALLVMDDAGRDRMLGRVRDYLHSRPETATGEFTLPMMTAVVRAVRV